MAIVYKSSCSKLGFAVRINLTITQHVRDELLMRSLIEYLGCGTVYFKGEAVKYRVTNFTDLIDKVIPFFKKHPIVGVKSQDFEDFCKIYLKMSNRAHLTEQGLDQIRKIKAGMNRNRMSDSSVPPIT